ncbi:hypothetical protein FB451DRAFT_1413056 [Mycena latifolia]|nr:hypothetical protein FB451DRAFT_1413056 [Mycena latifolia]
MDLQTIQSLISGGTRLSKQFGADVVDVGSGMLVKFGHRVHPREGHVAAFVASQTSVPVPKVHAVVTDTSDSDSKSPVTYIGKTKLQASLYDALPDILNQLAALDTARTQLGPYEGAFTGGCFGAMKAPCPAKTTAEFVNLDKGRIGFTPEEETEWLSAFDMARPHIFAHGDLVPENIFVDPETGAVTGIIDWELAGWVPYFWNDFMRRAWWEVKEWHAMMDKLLPQGWRKEASTFELIWCRAELFC